MQFSKIGTAHYQTYFKSQLVISFGKCFFGRKNFDHRFCSTFKSAVHTNINHGPCFGQLCFTSYEGEEVVVHFGLLLFLYTETKNIMLSNFSDIPIYSALVYILKRFCFIK